MKTFITLIRWFVGLLFIFSGLIKANDPLGLSYKMQEFFEVWGLHGLQDYTLWFSLMMNINLSLHLTQKENLDNQVGRIWERS